MADTDLHQLDMSQTLDTNITEHEAQQVERANATGLTPVVFVHGLWLLPSSCDRWATVFEEAGYTALAPGWPDDPETVAEANAHPEVFAHKTVGQVADHFAGVIGRLDRKPPVIGQRLARGRRHCARVRAPVRLTRRRLRCRRGGMRFAPRPWPRARLLLRFRARSCAERGGARRHRRGPGEAVDSTLRAQVRPVDRQSRPPVLAPKASSRRLEERREVRAREQLVAAWLRSLSKR